MKDDVRESPHRILLQYSMLRGEVRDNQRDDAIFFEECNCTGYRIRQVNFAKGKNDGTPNEDPLRANTSRYKEARKEATETKRNEERKK